MLLQKGSKGDDVKKLQSRLIELGYICGTGTADGIYGTGTYNSVKDFQRLNGLNADGIAGQNTLTALYSANPERYEFIPGNDDIVGYAVNAISRWEGNYTSINPREPVSIGILQWYQERAHDLLCSMREQDARLVENTLGKDSALVNELKQDRSVFSGRYLTNEEKVVLADLLNTRVSHKVQDKTARTDVEGYIENGKRKGITDEKALIYYADLFNQSPKQAKVITEAIEGEVTLDKIHAGAMMNTVMRRYAARRTNVYDAANSFVGSTLLDKFVNTALAECGTVEGANNITKYGEWYGMNGEIGESAMDMPIPYPVENARHNHIVDNGKPQGAKLAAAMADKPVQRTSLREKLEAFKAKVSGTDKLSIEKAKGKEETL